LAQVLRLLPPSTDPDLLVGTETRDDAAVYRIGARVLVFTADFFAPVVDDPFDYGRIAAANALSDVYAMGAVPMLALNLLGFPAKVLAKRTVGRILAGGAAACAEAGATIGGGHTIDDPEPKFGLAVIGTTTARKVWRNVGARPGDVLVLTKPLGLGIVTTAIKRQLARPAEIREATRVMATLNRDAADVLRRQGGAVHAVTDVTGFGLVGHLLEMLDGSHVGATLGASAVPILPSARRLLAVDCVPGGTKANLAAAGRKLVLGRGVDAAMGLLLADAQTSGGLLAAIDPRIAPRAVAALQRAGVPAVAIGECTAGKPRIRVAP
jgi:selenide,water dikinase